MSTMPEPNSPETISHLPAHALAERAALKMNIFNAQHRLESLRNQETALREALASKIDVLAFRCQRAAFYIRTNEYRDGHASLDVAFDEVRDAEAKLVSLLEDIHLREIGIADMRNTYNDLALWR
jgi:hypothetical protein